MATTRTRRTYSQCTALSWASLAPFERAFVLDELTADLDREAGFHAFALRTGPRDSMPPRKRKRIRDLWAMRDAERGQPATRPPTWCEA